MKTTINQKTDVTFLIEKGLWDPSFYTTDLSFYRDAGFTVKEVEFVTDYNKICASIANSFDAAINEIPGIFVPYGCINFIKYVRKFPNARIYLNDNFVYHNYATKWARFMLNKHGHLSTYGMVKYCPTFWGDRFFMRPSANNKIFTGRMFYSDTFENDIKYMGYTFIPDFIPDTELVFVAPPKNISYEWRFVIINKQIAGSTLYSGKLCKAEERGCNNSDVIAFVHNVVQDQWQPEDCYTLDVGITSTGEIGIIEIGSINSSGLYQIDHKELSTKLASYIYSMDVKSSTAD